MKTILCLLCLSLPAFAGETNIQFVVRTNWVTAATYFREVNGQLYNIVRSQKFENVTASVLSVSTNGVLCNWTKTKPIYGRSPHSDSLVSHGNFLGSSGMMHVPAPIIGHETVFSKDIMVQNYPFADAADGQTVTFYAMRIGVQNLEGRTLELYDAGTPHVVAVLTTNKISFAARNAIFTP